MIISPISIATKGVYAGNRNLGLASKGYIDDFDQQEPIAGWGGLSYLSQEEDDIYCLTQAILIAMRSIQ